MMNHMSAVRRFTAGDVPAAAAIIRGLPDYFTDDVPEKAERDAASHQAWVIIDSERVARFAVAARKSPGGAEVLWIAVDAALRLHPHRPAPRLAARQPGRNLRSRPAPNPADASFS